MARDKYGTISELKFLLRRVEELADDIEGENARKLQQIIRILNGMIGHAPETKSAQTVKRVVSRSSVDLTADQIYASIGFK